MRYLVLAILFIASFRADAQVDLREIIPDSTQYMIPVTDSLIAGEYWQKYLELNPIPIFRKTDSICFLLLLDAGIDTVCVVDSSNTSYVWWYKTDGGTADSVVNREGINYVSGTNMTITQGPEDLTFDATDTDDQQVDNFSIVSDILSLEVEDDGQAPHTVDLSPYLDNTDNQQVTNFSIAGDTLTLEVEDDGQAPHTVDLSPYIDTDSQNIHMDQDTGYIWISRGADTIHLELPWVSSADTTYDLLGSFPYHTTDIFREGKVSIGDNESHASWLRVAPPGLASPLRPIAEFDNTIGDPAFIRIENDSMIWDIGNDDLTNRFRIYNTLRPEETRRHILTIEESTNEDFMTLYSDTFQLKEYARTRTDFIGSDGWRIWGTNSLSGDMISIDPDSLPGYVAPDDADFWEVGTDAPPDDIGDTIYTQGKVVIGADTTTSFLGGVLPTLAIHSGVFPLEIISNVPKTVRMRDLDDSLSWDIIQQGTQFYFRGVGSKVGEETSGEYIMMYKGYDEVNPIITINEAGDGEVSFQNDLITDSYLPTRNDYHSDSIKSMYYSDYTGHVRMGHIDSLGKALGVGSAAIPADEVPYGTGTDITSESAFTYTPGSDRLNIGNLKTSFGNTSAGGSNVQVRLGFTSGLYNQSISTRHASGSAALNAIDFYTWQPADGASGDPSVLGLTIKNGQVGVGQSSPSQTLDVNGTARIVTATGTPTLIMGRNSGGDVGTVSTGGGLSLSSGTLSATDQSVSNEGSLTVGIGGATTSQIISNTSGSTPITLSAGTNISLSEAGSTITITGANTTSFNFSIAGGDDKTITSTGFDFQTGPDGVIQPNLRGTTGGVPDYDWTIVNDRITEPMLKMSNGATSGYSITWNGTNMQWTNIGGSDELGSSHAAENIIYSFGAATNSIADSEAAFWYDESQNSLNVDLVKIDGRTGSQSLTSTQSFSITAASGTLNFGSTSTTNISDDVFLGAEGNDQLEIQTSATDGVYLAHELMMDGTPSAGDSYIQLDDDGDIRIQADQGAGDNLHLIADDQIEITAGDARTTVGTQLAVGRNLADGLASGGHVFFSYGSAYNGDGNTLWETTSDIRTKDRIKDVGDAYNKLLALRPVSFHYNQKHRDENNIKADRRRWGYIAQEYQEVFPEDVRIGQDGFLSMSPSAVTPHIVAAVQQLIKDKKALEAIIAKQEDRLRAIENRLTELDRVKPAELQIKEEKEGIKIQIDINKQ